MPIWKHGSPAPHPSGSPDRAATGIERLVSKKNFDEFVQQEASLSPHGHSPGENVLLRVDLLRLMERWADPGHASKPSALDASRLAAALGARGFSTLSKRWSPTPKELWDAMAESAQALRWAGVGAILSHPSFDLSAGPLDAANRMAAHCLRIGGRRYSGEGSPTATARAALEAVSRQGLDPAWADEKGRTLLSLAALEGNLSWVKKMLALGADPQAANHDGDTPAHVAMDRLAGGGARESGQELAAATEIIRAGGGDQRCRAAAMDLGQAMLVALIPPEPGSSWLDASAGDRTPLARLLDGMRSQALPEDETTIHALASIAQAIASGPEEERSWAALELARAEGATHVMKHPVASEQFRRLSRAALESGALASAAAAPRGASTSLGASRL